MIQLHSDYLLIENAQGQIIPCAAELVAVELIGEAGSYLDADVVQEAASAVLHYFKQDLGCTTVSVGEFSRALEQALHSLGVTLNASPSKREVCPSYDLRELAAGAGRAFELGFFPRLREQMRTQLGDAPPVLQFHGLRGCVKELVGAKRWCHRCQSLNDQIVDYLRACLATESSDGSCGLVIR